MALLDLLPSSINNDISVTVNGIEQEGNIALINLNNSLDISKCTNITIEDIKTEIIKIPYDFYYKCAVLYNNEIHIVSGVYDVHGNKENDGDNYKYKHYKWNGFTWVLVSNIPYYADILNDSSYNNTYGPYGGSTLVYNDEIHVLGELRGWQQYESPYLRLHMKWNGSEWKQVSVLPIDYFDKTAVVLNNKIYIVSLNEKKIYKWNGENNTTPVTDSSDWEMVFTIDDIHDSDDNYIYRDAVVFDNKIHLMSSKAYYVWDSTTYTKVADLPEAATYDNACDDVSAVVYNNEIHIFCVALYSSDEGPYYHYKWTGSEWVVASTIPYECSGKRQIVTDGNKIYDISTTGIHSWDGATWKLEGPELCII